LGIARQLKLDVKQYTLADLETLTRVLQNRVNHFADYVSESQRDSFDKKRTLFIGAAQAYKEVSKKYPFLYYSPKSIKPSIFSYLGNYLGFQGYYNPFSGEGQVNTTIPRFLEPFVTTHEMAHQLGYSRENEANFVGYLACKNYKSDIFRYSVYYDMYNYALSELSIKDSSLARKIQQNAHPQVKKDQLAYLSFYNKYKNPVEPLIMWGYGHFLKANNQPAGTFTYNEVVLWLIAYYKRYGIEDL
jgi:hypothetical protein